MALEVEVLADLDVYFFSCFSSLLRLLAGPFFGLGSFEATQVFGILTTICLTGYFSKMLSFSDELDLSSLWLTSLGDGVDAFVT